jgi:hypothetical protein
VKAIDKYSRMKTSKKVSKKGFYQRHANYLNNGFGDDIFIDQLNKYCHSSFNEFGS